MPGLPEASSHHGNLREPNFPNRVGVLAQVVKHILEDAVNGNVR